MSVARKTALLLGSRLGTLLITTATGIVLNRVLKSEGRGAFVLATGLAFTQLQSLFSFGIQVSAQVLVAKDRARFSALHAWSLVLAAGVQLIAALAAFVCWVPLTTRIFEGIAPLHLVAITATAGAAFYWMAWQGLMTGLGDVRGLAALNFRLSLTQNLLIVLLLAIYAFRGWPRSAPELVDVLVCSYAGVQVLYAGAMAHRIATHGALWAPLRLADARELLSFGARVHIGNFASILLSQLDSFLVNGLAGKAALGVYQQASSLANKVWMIPSGIESSAYPQVAGAETDRRAREVTADMFRATFYISLGVAAAGWALAPLLPVIYGADFAATIAPFRVLILGTAAFGTGRMISMYITGYRKSPQTLLVLNWVLLPLLGALLAFLTQSHGLIGAALATSLAYLASMLTLLLIFRRFGADAGGENHPPLSRMFVLQPGDLARFREILRRRKSAPPAANE